MLCLSVVDHILCLSPLEECREVVEEVLSLSLRHCKTVSVLCCSLTSFCCKEVHLITRPSAREIHAESSVVAVVVRQTCSLHDLVTGKDLRITAHSCKKHIGNLQTCRILLHDVTDAWRVVVTCKDQHIRHVLIDKVMRNNVIDCCKSLAPTAVVVRKTCLDSVSQREVHDRRKVRVEAVFVGIVLLPVSKLRD